jgi:hypothetical protein
LLALAALPGFLPGFYAFAQALLAGKRYVHHRSFAVFGKCKCNTCFPYSNAASFLHVHLVLTHIILKTHKKNA